MRTWALLAMIGVGLLGSLHSLPFTSESPSGRRTGIPFERGVTVISGTIETVDHQTASLIIRTDEGANVRLQLTQKGLERFHPGDRVDVEIVLEEGSGMEYVVPAKSQPAKITI